VQWTAGPVLARDRVARVDTAILSHPNLDHYSAVPDLAERSTLGGVVVSPYFAEAEQSEGAISRLLERIKLLRVPLTIISRGDCVRGANDATVEVLWPPATGCGACADANEASIVLRIGWAGRRILLCGDIGPRRSRN